MSNKFGLFIHWGVYSIDGLHEQAMAKYGYTHEAYEKMAMTFNPVKYNPAEWVTLAKNAGMKYICFTAKHHDGFCMWDTKYTDYNIMNTPYKKDVLKMLASECEKQGLLLSIYYSNPDWHHEYGYNPNSTHQDKARNKENPNIAPYIEYVKNQITELMTNYGKIYSLFWDIPPKIEDKSINELVRKLQPGILINDRGFSDGDFSTPEREFEELPSSARFERRTEACNSVSEESWGYRKDDSFYSIRFLTQAIDHVMAMGGSYLLNVGPKPDGTIDVSSSKRIQRIGDWYNRMEGCLTDTETDDFDYQIYKYKYIANKKDGKTYIHFYEGLTATSVTFKNHPSMPKSVILKNNNMALDYKIDFLPGHTNSNLCTEKYLCIRNIPVDDFENEPIVLEITW